LTHELSRHTALAEARGPYCAPSGGLGKQQYATPVAYSTLWRLMSIPYIYLDGFHWVEFMFTRA